MLEAQWSLEFISNQNKFGAGVVVLETECIRGGDSSFLYVGTYKYNNGKVTANVKCTNSAGLLQSVFGDLREFNLILEGEPKHDVWMMSGYMVEDPKNKIAVCLTRQAELP